MLSVNIKVLEYKKWLTENVVLTDPFSPNSLRELVCQLLLGKNYRTLTEESTREKLLATYAWLIQIYEASRDKYGKNWREMLLENLMEKKKTREEKNLMHWLVGLTIKTAKNLDISPNEFPEFLKQTIKHCRKLFSKITLQSNNIEDTAWLLMMAGTATLNIRGSYKSKIGKDLERVFLRTILTVLGLEYSVNFWINIDRDIEVGRETDAEVLTRRGRIRIDIGLISSGNQEVIEDKINRVGTNGIVIFDKIGARSNIHETANRNRVKLIQIRHNQPLVEIKRYLSPLIDIELKQIPQTEAEIRQVIKELPDALFSLNRDI